MKHFISKIHHLVRASKLLDGGCHTTQATPIHDCRSSQQATSKTPCTNSISDITPENAPIEDLPPELRCEILGLLDLGTLQHLTRASPVFFSQYVQDRTRILCRCLGETLGCAALDAYWAYKTGQDGFQKGLSSGVVGAFSQVYEYEHLSGHFSLSAQELSEDDLTRMVSFHLSIVEPTLRLFTTQMLENLAREARKPVDDGTLSETEQRRLLRAFYRYQLTSNILERSKFSRTQDVSEEGWSSGPWWYYVSIFEPWELEEIACVHRFAKRRISKRRFEQIFDEIRLDSTMGNTRVDSVSRTTTGAPGSKNTSGMRLEAEPLQGLRLIHNLFFDTNHGHLASSIQNSHNIEDDILSESAQFFRRRANFGDRDWKEQRRDEFVFEKDDEPNAPSAWTSIWDGTYSNKYGYVIPNELRDWGYVMWDKARMERSGAEQVLTRQWNRVWGNSDPRYEDM